MVLAAFTLCALLELLIHNREAVGKLCSHYKSDREHFHACARVALEAMYPGCKVRVFVITNLSGYNCACCDGMPEFPKHFPIYSIDPSVQTRQKRWSTTTTVTHHKFVIVLNNEWHADCRRVLEHLRMIKDRTEYDLYWNSHTTIEGEQIKCNNIEDDCEIICVAPTSAEMSQLLPGVQFRMRTWSKVSNILSRVFYKTKTVVGKDEECRKTRKTTQQELSEQLTKFKELLSLKGIAHPKWSVTRDNRRSVKHYFDGAVTTGDEDGKITICNQKYFPILYNDSERADQSTIEKIKKLVEQYNKELDEYLRIIREDEQLSEYWETIKSLKKKISVNRRKVNPLSFEGQKEEAKKQLCEFFRLKPTDNFVLTRRPKKETGNGVETQFSMADVSAEFSSVVDALRHLDGGYNVQVFSGRMNDL